MDLYALKQEGRSSDVRNAEVPNAEGDNSAFQQDVVLKQDFNEEDITCCWCLCGSPERA